MGSTVATSNASGTVQSSNLYEAYGGIVLSTGSSQNNRLANTKERDFSIGLDNHGFRYFDPEVGRYVSPDPMGYPNGLNNYLYVENNPINDVDPHGLFIGWLWGVVKKAIGLGGKEVQKKATKALVSMELKEQGRNLTREGAGLLLREHTRESIERQVTANWTKEIAATDTAIRELSKQEGMLTKELKRAQQQGDRAAQSALEGKMGEVQGSRALNEQRKEEINKAYKWTMDNVADAAEGMSSKLGGEKRVIGLVVPNSTDLYDREVSPSAGDRTRAAARDAAEAIDPGAQLGLDYARAWVEFGRSRLETNTRIRHPESERPVIQSMKEFRRQQEEKKKDE